MPVLTIFSLVSSWVTGHSVWTLQKAENKTKAASDSGKVDQTTEVIGSSPAERENRSAPLVAGLGSWQSADLVGLTHCL